MKMHYQTVELGPENDSLRACVASCLDFADIKTLPVFKRYFGTPRDPLTEWLRERGMDLMVLATHDIRNFLAFTVSYKRLFILGGPSTQGDIHHVVCDVAERRIRVVHNPTNSEKLLDYSKPEWKLYFITKKAL